MKEKIYFMGYMTNKLLKQNLTGEIQMIGIHTKIKELIYTGTLLNNFLEIISINL